MVVKLIGVGLGVVLQCFIECELTGSILVACWGCIMSSGDFICSLGANRVILKLVLFLEVSRTLLRKACEWLFNQVLGFWYI